MTEGPSLAGWRGLLDKAWRSPRRKATTTVLVSALLSGVVGTVFSPDTIRAGFGSVFGEESRGDDSAGGAEPDQSLATIDLRPAWDATRALTMLVPVTWEVGRKASYDDARGVALGPGMVAGPPGQIVNSYSTYSTPRAFLGASRSEAKRLQLARTDDQTASQRINAELAARDWTLDGCSLRSDETYRRAGYVGGARVWVNCGGIGAVFREVLATSADRSHVVDVQVQVPDEADAPLLERVSDSFEVFVAALPPAKAIEE